MKSSLISIFSSSGEGARSVNVKREENNEKRRGAFPVKVSKVINQWKLNIISSNRKDLPF